jgi:hypothetical protein
MRGLRLGAVVLLDALGFKGIWNRFDPKVVIEQLKKLKREGLRLVGDNRTGVLLLDETFEHTVRCISDTIIVAVTIRGSASPGYPDRLVHRAMLSAVLIASHLMDSALDGIPPFLFRGCMAAGRMNIDGDFMIGPAVDEAAGFFEQSDGPFFWMAPSALHIVDEYAETFFDRIEPIYMIRYPVPMKNGTTMPTLVHHYFGLGLTLNHDKWVLTRQKLIQAFGTELRQDIVRKRHNAVAFLDHVSQIAATAGPFTSMSFTREPYLEDLTHNQIISILHIGGIEMLHSLPRKPPHPTESAQQSLDLSS